MKMSLSLKVPASLMQPVNVRQTFNDTVGGAVRYGLQAIMAEIIGETSVASIADAYQIEEVEGGLSMTFRIVNTNPAWPFKEKDTAPHFPPFGPGTNLFEWALKRDLEPFVVAKGISERGTKGDYVVARVWARSEDELFRHVAQQVRAWAASYGGIA